MNTSIQKACIWVALFGAALIGVAFVIMGFIPAPPPSASAAEIAAMFRANAFGMVVGATLLTGAFAMMIPLYAVISGHIETMEIASGSPRAPLAKAQLALGVIAVCVPGVVGSACWMAAGYRPERPDEIILLLNDLGWMIIFAAVIAGLLQVFMLGIAIFADRSASPVFPRWFGYFNVWIGVAFLPGGLLALFRTGPFAWNGLFCYWLGLSAFGLWFGVTAWQLFRAAR